MKKNLLIFFVLLLLLAVLYLGYGYVAAAAGEEGLSGVDLTVEGLFNIVAGLACWLTRGVFPIMVIFLVIAALRFMHARGNPALFIAAKKNFTYVLIGIIVIMGVYVIIATVANAVGITNFSLIPLVC